MAELKERFGPRWSWGVSVHVSAPHECFVFEALAALQNRFSSAKVYIVRGYVAKRLVIPARVVVVYEATDLLPELVRKLPDDKGNLLLAGPMIPFDLSVCLRMVRRSEYVAQTLGLKVFTEGF